MEKSMSCDMLRRLQLAYDHMEHPDYWDDDYDEETDNEEEDDGIR